MFIPQLEKTQKLDGYWATSPECPECRSDVTVFLEPEKVFAYQRGERVDVVLEKYPVGTRERFITGLCPGCWDKIFSETEEEEEE